MKNLPIYLEYKKQFVKFVVTTQIESGGIVDME